MDETSTTAARHAGERCDRCGGPLAIGGNGDGVGTCPACHASLVVTAVPALPGKASRRRVLSLPREIDARFVPLRWLGQGTSGTVFHARERATGRDVALKLLQRSLDEEAARRFAREVRLLERVCHPNVVAVIDAFEWQGCPCLVTEYVPGGTLREMLGRKGPLAWREAARVAVEILEGLQACHELGIVHRDVKPENVLIDGDGRAKIADFGLARATGGPDCSLTAPGILLGTPIYMSPEQLRGEPPTAATDIHAAAALLYEMVESRPPHWAADLVTLLDLKSRPVVMPRVTLPGELAEVLRSALSPRIEDRPPSARAMARMLAAVGGGIVPASFAAAPGTDLSAAADEQLVALTGGGDRLAFGEIVRRHQERAWRIAYRFVGNPTDAQDIAQKAFLRIFEASPRYRPTARFTTYLHCVIARLCSDHRERPVPARVESLEALPAPGSSVGSRVDRRERANRVREALDRLPADYRLAVVFRYYEGLSARDTAEALGITPKAVERMLARARGMLLRILEPTL